MIIFINTVICTFNINISNFAKQSSCGNDSVFFAYESTYEIGKHCVDTSSGGDDVAMKYQVHLWEKTLESLADIDTFEDIYLIQGCIYHDQCKILSIWY